MTPDPFDNSPPYEGSGGIVSSFDPDGAPVPSMDAALSPVLAWTAEQIAATATTEPGQTQELALLVEQLMTNGGLP